MTAWRRICNGAVVAGLVGVVPARADVIAQTELGFVSRNVVVVAGTPGAVWKRLVTPATWWSPDHTFSGDAANLTLDPVAGGCFCERLPAESAAPPAKGGAHPAARGGVEHMRVVFVDHAKALRLVGGLGPLQSEAVSATLTVTLAPVDGGTRVIFEYVVGGYMRYPPDKIAPAVDTVMGNQLLSLAHLFAPVTTPSGVAPPPAAVASPVDNAPRTDTVGRGLDKNGVLLPRGRVWSLPSSAPPAPAAPAEPLPNVAPLPIAPVPQDVAPTGGTAPAKRRTRHKPAEPAPTVDAAVAMPQESAPAAAPETPDAAVAPTPPKPKPPAKKPVKPVKKTPEKSDEPSKESLDSAFDAAFGGVPRPPSQ